MWFHLKPKKAVRIIYKTKSSVEHDINIQMLLETIEQKKKKQYVTININNTSIPLFLTYHTFYDYYNRVSPERVSLEKKNRLVLIVQNHSVYDMIANVDFTPRK